MQTTSARLIKDLNSTRFFSPPGEEDVGEVVLPRSVGLILSGPAIQLEIDDAFFIKVDELKKKLTRLKGRDLIKKSGKEESNRFDEIKNSYQDATEYTQFLTEINANVSLSELIAELKILCRADQDDQLTIDEKILREEYKLAIMQSTLNHLQKKCSYVKPEVFTEEHSSAHFIVALTSESTRKKLFNVLLGIEVAPMMVGEFINGMQLFSMLPRFLAGPFSALLTLIECGIFYSTMGQVLKQTLGIEHDVERNAMVPLTKQIQVANHAYRLLNDAAYYDQLDIEHYSLYATLLEIFHSQQKKMLEDKLTFYQEPMSKKAIRFIASSVDFSLTFGSGVFLGKALLVALGVTVSAAVSVGVIVTLAALLLLPRLFGSTDSVFRSLNPLALFADTLKKKQFKFVHSRNNKTSLAVFAGKKRLLAVKKELGNTQQIALAANDKLISLGQEPITAESSQLGLFARNSEQPDHPLRHRAPSVSLRF